MSAATCGTWTSWAVAIRTILIQRELSGEPLRAALLHEMCHAAAPADEEHGPVFRRELARHLGAFHRPRRIQVWARLIRKEWLRRQDLNLRPPRP